MDVINIIVCDSDEAFNDFIKRHSLKKSLSFSVFPKKDNFPKEEIKQLVSGFVKSIRCEIKIFIDKNSELNKFSFLPSSCGLDCYLSSKVTITVLKELDDDTKRFDVAKFFLGNILS